MKAEYERRLEQRRQALAKHRDLSANLSTARLATVAAGIALGVWNIWLAPFAVIAFVALLVYHEKVERSITFELRAVAYYERGIDRVEGRWSGSGATGRRFPAESHPYASDLDVFGKGSIFQFINAARTSAGESTLADWLMQPGELDVVKKRQQAVRDLRERLDLREDIALLGSDVRAGLHPEALMNWGEQPSEYVGAPLRIAAFLFALSTATLATGFFLQLWSGSAVVIGVLAQSVFALVVRNRVLRILASVNLPAKDLSILSQVLERFERESFQAPRLIELKQQLQTDGQLPSKQIARLHRLLEYHDWARNQMFIPIARLLLWSTQFAFAIENWRRVSGPSLRSWIAAIGELEALSSIAGYASEHPDDVFPELVDGGTTVVAKGVAHPLLPASAVRNDVHLDEQHQLLLISGSNMSGKSTLLRSVGLNVVLAWVGAPVRARSFRVSQFNVGAAMRVQDSLQDGKSRFYAEITRLRQIVDLASQPRPLLFLLDELLSGTNSHDRRIGAEAIVLALVRKGAIGLVTTHDLALARIVEALGDRAMNVHFQDHLENGEIAFDYKMRPGVVEKSNALALMRSIGLEV